MSSVIVLDSSEDEAEKAEMPKDPKKPDLTVRNPFALTVRPVSQTPPKSTTPRPTETVTSVTCTKRKQSESSENGSDRSVKRIKPTQISKTVDKSWFQTQSPVIPAETTDEDNKKNATRESAENSTEASKSPKPEETPDIDRRGGEETPLTPTFELLLKACKAADPSPDMDTLIEKKLLKYYQSVHPDFVHSKGFSKTIRAVIEEIKTSPQLVYYKLKTVVEELKIRKKSRATVMSNEDVTTTGDERKDNQIKRLSRALYLLTKKISLLEQADVDWNEEDNSAYLQLERCKRRACEIYEKICDLTGESKHAHRLVRKPISYNGTVYPQFNTTIQAFVNRTNSFPDFFDVLRCLEHCNTQYGFDLKNDEIRKIAQDAFSKIGKLLQNRRKTDLYETVAHFAGTLPDPAISDTELNAKLLENQRHHSKISALIDQFAKQQEQHLAESKQIHENKKALTNGGEKDDSRVSPSAPEASSSNTSRVENGQCKPTPSSNSINPKEPANGTTSKTIVNGETTRKCGAASATVTSTVTAIVTPKCTLPTIPSTSSMATLSYKTVDEIVISDEDDL